MNYIAIVNDQLNTMGESILRALPGLVVALAILVLTWLVAKFAVRISERLVGRSDIRESLKNLVETLVRLTIWVIGLLIAAAIAIPGFTPAGMIAGLGIGAVAIAFAFQDILENFLAGVLIMLREKMQIGDVVEAEGILGKVEVITLRETHIRQLSGELTILPNSLIFKNPVKIYTEPAERRNELVVGVSYDTDLQQAETVIRQALEDVTALSQNRKIDIYAQEFNSSSVDFLVRWWTDIRENDYLAVRAQVVTAIKHALDREGIEIPFPYLTHTFKEPVPFSS